MTLEHADITKEIIGAAFEVHRILGYGFLESVYQRAMQVELIRRGLTAELERKIKVIYKDVIVGDFEADIFVGDKVLVEMNSIHDDLPRHLGTADERRR